MLINIRSDIFNSLKNFRRFSLLFNVLLDDSKHEVFIDFHEIQSTDFYKQLGEIDKETIKLQFTKFVSDSKKKFDYIVQQTETHDRFNIDEAIIYFNQPVLIILENDLNDSHFFNVIFSNFPEISKKIRHHKKNAWLKYSNAGGCTNIINHINAIITSYAALPKDNFRYLRCFVLIDSDKYYPAMKLNNARDTLITFLKDNNIPHHILEKREAENYIPNEVLVTVGGDYLQSYMNLNPTQKDFFDVEKGFHKKDFKNLEVEIQKLYNSVSTKQYELLRLGMNLPQYEKKFKSEFPKLFNHPAVNKTSLKNNIAHQTDPDEFENIIEKINKML